MKYSQLVLLLGAASVSGIKLEKNQRSLFDTSLVMLEAGIPVPTTPVVTKKQVETAPTPVKTPASTQTPATTKKAEKTKETPISKKATESPMTSESVKLTPAIKKWQTDAKEAPSTDPNPFLAQSEKIEKSSFVSTKAENEVVLDQQAEVDRKKKKSKSGPTTLTIVQDFPKKRSDGQPKMQLVQGKETNMNTQKDFSVQGQQPTTLTIVQDFPKKRSDHSKSHNIEMVQGKAKDFSIEAPSTETAAHHVSKEKKVEMSPFSNDADHGGEGTTLTIVQEFPKKQSESEHQGSELVQAEEHHQSTLYERGTHKMAMVGNALFQVKTFIEDLFGVNK